MRNMPYLLLVFTVITFISAGAASIIYSPGIVREDDIQITASFYPVYITAKKLLYGVDGVQLNSLSEPQTGCLHDYVLSPQDMKLLKESDALLVNGGGMEVFLDDVISDCPKLTIIDTSKGLTNTIDDNSHYWMSISLYRNQVNIMADRLCSLLSGDLLAVEEIKSNRDSYISEIDSLISDMSTVLPSLRGTPVILFHEAYEYVSQDYGLETCIIIDLDEERQVSANEVSEALDTIRQKKVPIVLADKIYGRSLGELLSKETPVDVIYLDTIVTSDDEYDSDGSANPSPYITRMQQNINLIKQSLEQK